MIHAIAAVVISASACAAPEAVQWEAMVVGQARSIGAAGSDLSALQYCEYFLVDRNDSGSVRVLYYDPRGNKIAEKHLSVPVASTKESAIEEVRPDVLQEDFRHGEIREISRVGGTLRMRYRKSSESSWRAVTAPDADVDVVDAGFDPFVRLHWEQFVSGDTVEFNFASPVHGQVIRLRARAVPCNGRVATSGHLCLTVDLAKPWLRWLAGDLFLAYSSQDRRLRHFRGVVNLRDARGADQKLSIDYVYR